MKLKEIDGKYYISIYQLLKLGFDYPPVGTMGIYETWSNRDRNYKFHGKVRGRDGICLSYWLSDVGKIEVPDTEFLVEFSTDMFRYKKEHQILPSYIHAGNAAKQYANSMNAEGEKNGFHELDFYNGTVWFRHMIEEGCDDVYACNRCEPSVGLYAGTTCPECKMMFRQVKNK